MSADYYSDIPERMLIKRNILDIGCGNGSSQLKSRHGNIFLEASSSSLYLGVEKEIQDTHLFIIQEDIRNVELPEDTFDTILLMHSLEHIPIDDWIVLFQRLKKSLVHLGWIVIAAPFNENESRKRDSSHVVFNITLNTLEKYLPEIQMFRASVKYRKHGNVRKIIWWFRQFINGVRYVPLGLTRYSFVAFWQKKRVT